MFFVYRGWERVRRKTPTRFCPFAVEGPWRRGCSGAACSEAPRLICCALRGFAKTFSVTATGTSTANILEASTGVECEPEAMAKALLR